MTSPGPQNTINVSFLVEWSLGHVTHGLNLIRSESDCSTINGTWHKLRYDSPSVLDRVPKLGANWTLRSGLEARKAISADRSSGTVDAIYIHTATAAVLAASHFKAVPAIVSLDATPRQISSMDGYGRAIKAGPVDHFKRSVTSSALRKAARLVVVSDWVAASLVDDYKVDDRKITTIPFPVDLSRFGSKRTAATIPGPIRLLFVGGDFVRKGGPCVLQAFAQLSKRYDIELDIVTNNTPTGAAIATSGPGESSRIRVHTEMSPNDEKLVELYEAADIFCLPTLGDCFPLALLEAAASGLASVTTSVGGIPDLVDDGRTGLLVAPGDDVAFVDALESLVASPASRIAMGAMAANQARSRFCAQSNGIRTLDLVAEAAADRRRTK